MYIYDMYVYDMYVSHNDTMNREEFGVNPVGVSPLGPGWSFWLRRQATGGSHPAGPRRQRLGAACCGAAGGDRPVSRLRD